MEIKEKQLTSCMYVYVYVCVCVYISGLFKWPVAMGSLRVLRGMHHSMCLYLTLASDKTDI